jgi:hypothetical protein
VVNALALEGLRDDWRLPKGLRDTTEIFVDASGVHKKQSATETRAKSITYKPLAKQWQIAIIEYISTPETEEGEKGVLAGLREAGLVRGKDFDVKIRNAQGDMVTVSNLVDAAMTDDADLLIAITTPALQAALRRGGTTPIIFTVVSDGVAAGAGRTARDHRANVTGIDYKGAYPEIWFQRGLPVLLTPRARRDFPSSVFKAAKPAMAPFSCSHEITSTPQGSPAWLRRESCAVKIRHLYPFARTLKTS